MANVPITENIPSITTDGIFSISPQFSKGLVLDTTTGKITGTPIEEYKGTYVVRFTETSTGTVLTSTLIIQSIIYII